MVIATRSHSAFFYGTLMHPKILAKVIKNDGSHLTIAPALLLDHTRHVVKHADYPGVAPLSSTQALFDRPLNRDESSVRGTFVSGLTDRDLKLLDDFEGNEYIRRLVEVHLLAEREPLSVGVEDTSLIPEHPPPLPKAEDLSGGVQAETYIYGNVDQLVPELWSFEDFVEKKAHNWYIHDPADFRW